MIETKELRLGNLIEYGEGEYSQIVRLHKIDGEYLDTHNVIDSFYGENKWFFPIPLTEEWLVKLGFSVLQEDEWQLGLKISAISLLCRQNSRHWYFQLSTIYLGEKFKYVHEVQNFCYSLGKELEVK